MGARLLLVHRRLSPAREDASGPLGGSCGTEPGAARPRDRYPRQNKHADRTRTTVSSGVASLASQCCHIRCLPWLVSRAISRALLSEILMRSAPTLTNRRRYEISYTVYLLSNRKFAVCYFYNAIVIWYSSSFSALERV